MPLILIIEDEAPIRDMIRLNLELAQFEVIEAENTQKAQALISKKIPDLILLDWMLPGLSGIDYAVQLKASPRSQDIPIILLTAKAEEENKVKGFEHGIDDYITKPFSPRELIARIKAVLRRGVLMTPDQIIQNAGIHLNLNTQEVRVQNKLLDLSPLEFKLLHFFMSHPDRVYSRDQLLNQVWGEDAYYDDRTVDVQIRRLRQCLTQHGHTSPIQTIRGSGYKFCSKKQDEEKL